MSETGSVTVYPDPKTEYLRLMTVDGDGIGTSAVSIRTQEELDYFRRCLDDAAKRLGLN